MTVDSETLEVQRWPNGRWTSADSVGLGWFKAASAGERLLMTSFQPDLFDAPELETTVRPKPRTDPTP